MGARPRRFMRAAELEFVFDQSRHSVTAPAILQRDQRQDVGRSSLKLRDQLLRSAAKECITNHGRNTDRQTCSGVDEGFTNPARERYVTRRPNIRTQCTKRTDDSKNSAKQTQQW